MSAEKDNFQHLTEVHSQISAQNFFDKCIDGSLSEDDFDFIEKGQDEKSVKGTVRRKIRARPKSLIKGNELKHPKQIELVLKRKTGTAFFDEFVIGDKEVLIKYKKQ